MSSEVETSFTASALDQLDGKKTVRDSSTSVGMTEKLLSALHVYHDFDSRSAAMNMAVDEALFEIADAPTLRFYRWDHPAVSFGYFGKFSDVQNLAEERDLVRRWTGGGIVFHDEDLTYSIIIPARDAAFAKSSMSIYEKIHDVIRAVLVTNGRVVELATVAAVSDRRSENN